MEHTLLMAVVVLLSLILLSLWLVLYQLVKQQGRMLLRLDRLEGDLPDSEQGDERGYSYRSETKM